MDRLENTDGGQDYVESFALESIEDCERFCQQTESCVAVVFYTFKQCAWFNDTNLFNEVTNQATAMSSFKRCIDCELFNSVLQIRST